MLRSAVSIFFLLCAFAAGAQPATPAVPDTPAYRRYPALPAFYIIPPDSSEPFNTYFLKEGKPTIFLYFSPDCDHCQMIVKELVENIDSLKAAEIYLITFAPLPELNAFAAARHLERYKNIHTGKDKDYFFPNFFDTKFVPFIAVYDRHKQLVAAREGGMKITELIGVVEHAK